MKQYPVGRILLASLAAGLTLVSTTRADTTISEFDDFNLDGLFANWASAAITSTSTNYAITASGFGSGYKQISPVLDATGETTIELTVTITSTAAPNVPVSGPIVSLVDGDGTFVNYAWYGQTKGAHVLTAKLAAPTSTSDPGSVSGLDLSTLSFFHLQDDPGSYQGQYTIAFEKLRLTGAPPLSITSQSFNPATQEFTLSWVSSPNQAYTVLHTLDLASPFQPLLSDIASAGTLTTATVVLPAGNAGFLRVLQQ